jgi:hypothetical protein
MKLALIFSKTLAHTLTVLFGTEGKYFSRFYFLFNLKLFEITWMFRFILKKIEKISSQCIFKSFHNPATDLSFIKK